MSSSSLKTRHRLLWTAQILVALLFVFAGAMKFVMPPEKMQQGPIVLPLAFLYFIGVCEILGGLGLVLPGQTRIATFLTPIAGAGLTIIMFGATVLSVIGLGVAGGILPAVVGALTTWIAYSRTRVVPLNVATRRVLQAA
ncbi:MAG TPA: DoxX family protein [Gemmatimonadaceae bacterium]|jgi:uncharacterized membrane protein YphA (DoxX/SURF4 family)